MKTSTKQGGFTLLELILVLGLMAGIMVMTFAQDQLDFEHKMAKTIGLQLLTHNNAVRKWMSENVDSAPALQVRNGTTWLKPTSCGGSTSRSEGFIPCDFPDYSSSDPVVFGNLSLETTITKTTNASGDPIITATSRISPFTLPTNSGAVIRADLSGLAAITASAGGFYTENPTPFTTDGSFKSDPVTGVITAKAGNNAATDAWLRTDGSNRMNNNLRFNSATSPTLREIQFISRLKNIAGQALFLGNSGGATNATPDKVVVDADTELMGKMLVINSKNEANAIDVTQGSLILRNGNVSADVFYDENNVAYYIDGENYSRLNRLKVKSQIELEDVVSAGATCNPNGSISRGANGEIYACVLGRWASTGGTSGMYAYFHSSTCPTGWVPADGGNGTADLRGRFIRTWDNGRGIDPGRPLVSVQGDDIRSHNHAATASAEGLHRHRF